MTFRTRVALAVAVGSLLPLVLLAVGVRREMTSRLERQAELEVRRQAGEIGRRLASQHSATSEQLRRLAIALADDNRFRLAIAADPADAWIRDWASRAMEPAGLAVLELQDSAGRVLSSGHFRNEFGLDHRGLVTALTTTGTPPVLIRASTPNGPVEVLGVAHRFMVAGRSYLLLGGRGLDLAPGGDGSDVAATLQLEAPPPAPTPAVVARFPLRLVASAEPHAIRDVAVVLTRDLSSLAELRRGVDRWFLIAAAVLVALAILLSLWLSDRVTRPIAELAARTSHVDLDRLDQTFSTGRDDEIGGLAKLLDAMTARLRASAARLRESERRAITGDLARQVNHDIKNGLAPIRHVLRHLGQVAREQPDRLAAVYRERQGTLDSSTEYLENLSRNYARLSPAAGEGTADVRQLLAEMATAHGQDGVAVQVLAGPANLEAGADPVILRRIMENLCRNAVEAARETGGRVTLQAESPHAGSLRLTVEDDGPGMTEAQLSRAFDDFYTTRAGGTGLGLSVVRRLVADLGGSLRVETAPGRGSRFIVELPAVPA